ncbi:MAG: MYG1 family protein [Myxococcales bacterium]|nr:MYG1 family protein [Myxococcales bacterium]
MLDHIVTHPGGAHKDDFLAVCVLAAKSGAPIQRREPSEDDLQNPRVAVVDIGGSHDPARMNFDHHHFPREHEPTSSISLVLAHLGLYGDARLFCPWLEPAEWFDSRGPTRTAEWLGVGRDVVAKLNSPIDVTLLRRFAASKQLAPGEPLYEVMRFIGEDLLTYLETIRSQLAFTAKHASRWQLETGGAPIEVVFLPRTEAETEEPSSAVAAFIRAQGWHPHIAATVYPDRRGPGYGISRYEDHPHLDFSRVQNEPDVHFAHKTGFMCKTSAIDPERLKDLIRQAWNAP